MTYLNFNRCAEHYIFHIIFRFQNVNAVSVIDRNLKNFEEGKMDRRLLLA